MMKNPTASRLFERLASGKASGVLGNLASNGPGNKNIQIQIGGNDPGKAKEMFRKQICKMMNENAGKQALQDLLQETLNMLDKK